MLVSLHTALSFGSPLIPNWTMKFGKHSEESVAVEVAVLDQVVEAIGTLRRPCPRDLDHEDANADVSKFARNVAGATSLSFAGVRSAAFGAAGLAVVGFAVAGFCVAGVVVAGLAGAGFACVGVDVAGFVVDCA